MCGYVTIDKYCLKCVTINICTNLVLSIGELSYNMKCLGLVFFLTRVFEIFANGNITYQVPEYILPCKRNDVNINKCLINTFNHLRPYLKDGISEIDVPSIDPLVIDNLVMENGRGPVRVKAIFFNITTLGASNYTVSEIKTNLDKYIIELGIILPKVEVRGEYDVDGNVLLFPIKSRGDFVALFTNVEGVGKIFGKEITNEAGVKFMKVDKLLVDFRLKKSRFRIKDIVNHGNLIGEAMNQFINANSKEIIKEMKPAASAAIASHFKSFLNRAFVKLPMQVWLPDS
ncbi:protein takeout-like [Diabrotica undecimpunctata]|uniref:protein takeout-like n=1 Tax=Diabrotica undecimpunctata TaxID=50387 RepID=UPI003B633645